MKMNVALIQFNGKQTVRVVLPGDFGRDNLDTLVKQFEEEDELEGKVLDFGSLSEPALNLIPTFYNDPYDGVLQSKDIYTLSDARDSFVVPRQAKWWNATEEMVLAEQRAEVSPDQLEFVWTIQTHG